MKKKRETQERNRSQITGERKKEREKEREKREKIEKEQERKRKRGGERVKNERGNEKARVVFTVIFVFQAQGPSKGLCGLWYKILFTTERRECPVVT